MSSAVENAPARPPAASSAETHGTSAAAAPNTLQVALQAAVRACDVHEDAFAREFVLRRNATAAYIASHPGCLDRMQRHVARQRAWEMTRRPHVVARVREYESAAAAACTIDVQALLEADLRIVQAANYADQLTQHLWQCCRYCHGKDHKYQWVDLVEYLEALSKVEEQNEERRARKVRELALPSDEGGFDFDPRNEPNIACPKCEGRGNPVTILCDTTKLEGPAAALFRGVRTTANGTELLMHDVDKAKERLLRAAGAFGDDAASVARGAAAGAAAGSAAGAMAAQKIAERAQEMTAEEVRRAYLSLVS